MSCFTVRLSVKTSICNFSKLKSVGKFLENELGPPMTRHLLAAFPHQCCRFVTFCIIGNKVPCEAGRGVHLESMALPRIKEATKASSNYENRP